METPFKMELRKERSFGDKMNGMFTYLSQNYKVIFRCMLFIVAPVALLGGICNGIFQSRMTEMLPLGTQGRIAKNFGTGPDAFSGMLENMLSPVYLFAILFTISGFVLVKCIVFSHLRLYSESPTKEVAFEQVWDDVKSNFIKVFFSVIGVTLLLTIAYVFLIIPGIYLTIALAMFIPAMVIERKGFGESFSRSFFLIRDKWWSTFGLLIITAFIVYFGSLIFYIPMYVFQILRLTRVVGDEVAIWQIIATALSSIGVMFIFSLFSFALGMQYFNLVERREGKGLRSYIDEIGNAPQAENNSNQIDL